MRNWMAWPILALCAGLALGAFAYPMAVIQPFQYQDPERLALALQVRQWAPAASLALAGIAVLSAIWIWRQGRIWKRAASLLLAILAMAGAALTRVNVFERMFAPIGEPRTEAAAEAKLDPDDMVLAVTAGGAARAYGVRMLAYHHIVNDWLAGVPLVGTY